MRKAVVRIAFVGLMIGIAAFGGRSHASEPARTSSRFSSDAIDLLHATSGPREINGQRSPGQMDRDAVLRAAKSSDPQVAEAALKWLDCYYLAHLNDANIKEIQAQIQAAVPKFAVLAVESLAISMKRADSGLQASDIAELGNGLSDMIREPQRAQIKQLRVQFAAVQSANAFNDSLRAIAEHGPAAPKSEAGNPQIQFITDLKADREHFGLLRVVNPSGRALHHCLILGRATMNRAALERLNAQGDSLAVLSALIGFAPDVAINSALDGRLRNAILCADRGMASYADELPANSTSYFLLFPLNSGFDYLASASVSLWSDECQITDLKIDNLAELQTSIRAARTAAFSPRRTRPAVDRKLITAKPDQKTCGLLSGFATRLQDGLMDVVKAPTTVAKEEANQQLLNELAREFKDKPAKFHFPILDVKSGRNGMFIFIVDRPLEADGLPFETRSPNQLNLRMTKAEALKATKGDVLVVSGLISLPSDRRATGGFGGPVRNARFGSASGNGNRQVIEPISVSSLVSRRAYTLSLREFTYQVEANK